MADLNRSDTEDLFERRRTAWLAEDTTAYLALWADDMAIELPGRDEPAPEAYRRIGTE